MVEIVVIVESALPRRITSASDASIHMRHGHLSKLVGWFGQSIIRFLFATRMNLVSLSSWLKFDS